MNHTNINNSNFINFYGRRAAHLTANHQSLLDLILPKYQLPTTNLSSFIENIQSKYSCINLEIGFGQGEFIFHNVSLHPNQYFIGAEVFANGVVALLRKIQESQTLIPNVSIYNNNVYHLLQVLPLNIFSNIYILFPDPWPKSKHKKRRLINEANLLVFYNLLKQNGKLTFISDHANYISHTLEHFLSKPKQWIWQNNTINSWHKLPGNYMLTRYHAKALKQQHSITCLEFVKQ